MATGRDLCCFKNLQVHPNGPTILAQNLNKFFNTTAFSIIEKQGATKDKCELNCSWKKIWSIRSNLASLLTTNCRSIWFVCPIQPAERVLDRYRSNADNTHTPCTVLYSFGSMVSFETFIDHTFDNRNPADIKINKDTRGRPKSVVLEPNHSEYRMILDLNMIHVDILIKHGQENQHEPMQIVFMLQGPPRFQKRLRTDKYVRICDSSKHNLSIDCIARCSDLWLQFKERRNAWSFLQQFCTSTHIKQFTLNFAEFQLTQSSNKASLLMPPNHNKFVLESGYYAMKMLWSLGYVFTDKYTTDPDLPSQFVSCHDQFPTKFYDLCCSLWRYLQQNHCYSIRNIFADSNVFISAPIKENYRVPHAIITPLRTLFQPLHSTRGHRAMRQHDHDKPPFKWMVVYIRDEDGVSNITNVEKVGEVRERYKVMLKNGLALPSSANDNLMYCYFGSSGSQTKKQEFWFMAPVRVKPAHAPAKIHEVRSALGDLKNIKNVSTYIARVGLYLTTSKPTAIKLTYIDESSSSVKRTLSWLLSFFANSRRDQSPVQDTKNNAYLIDDIERNGYCFTDGVGQISLGLAKDAAKAVGIRLNQREDVPSAYQVRVAGCKGMLSIDPISTEHDHYIKVRKSMMKFNSDNWTLEIVDYSRIMCLSLNNQVIRLLCDLNPNNRAVIESLQNRCISQDHWHPPEETYLNVFDLQKMDRIRDEHRRKGYLNARGFLRRNRIPLPVDEARSLFGIADETQSLKEGQCFIQYQTMNRGSYRVVKGTVLVTKNPCLYPGDIRRLEAVDIPALRSCIRDCIVFPVHGSRPHSNEIAGSDLDGDIYWVYWGTELTINEVVPPLAYTPAPKKTGSKVTPELIIDHILNTLGNSASGIICNTHAVIADKAEGGTKSNDCRYLAELFPRAIDAIKTGEQINMERVMHLKDRWCDTYPTWMMKDDKQSYDSTSINEYLFRKSAQLNCEKLDRVNQQICIPIIMDDSGDERESAPIKRQSTCIQFCRKRLWCILLFILVLVISVLLYVSK